MKRILVPTDFSDNSLKGALYAAEIADKTNAVVYFVHVADRLQGKDALDAFTQRITQVYKQLKTTSEVITGKPADAICDFAVNQNIELIVMGTKGASGIKRFFVGSITANVITNTAIPVMAIPDEYTPEDPDSILFATNHFERDTNVLSKLIAIATLFSATIHIVTYEDTDSTDDTNKGHNPDQLNEYLNFLRNTFPGVSFKGEILQGSSFEGAIELYDVRNDVDIIAMVSYPKTFWQKFLQQSATRKMAFHSRIPILAIPTIGK